MPTMCALETVPSQRQKDRHHYMMDEFSNSPTQIISGANCAKREGIWGEQEQRAI